MQAWQDALSKLHPDSPEFQQGAAWLQALDRPRHSALWRRAIKALIFLAVVLFLLSKMLAGRWLVALSIPLLSLIAFLILKVIGRRH
jgi:antibiotic biosynthesis monooxygenase (ABM) superfamily enzyme